MQRPEEDDGFGTVREVELGAEPELGNSGEIDRQESGIGSVSGGGPRAKTINIKIDIMRGEAWEEGQRPRQAADWWHRIPSPLDIRIETGATIQELKTRIMVSFSLRQTDQLSSHQPSLAFFYHEPIPFTAQCFLFRM